MIFQTIHNSVMTVEFVDHVFAYRTLHMAYISKGIDNRISV